MNYEDKWKIKMKKLISLIINFNQAQNTKFFKPNNNNFRNKLTSI